ncbi:hypothetical protein [Actinoplanes couchii]|uniref:hypothetical protein n=1 Tax=Actinoplanes couchii TaxID=403638 RepID=UPI001941E3D2|nr:hypothetical protein [Actinoplanes couchii]MDR6325262.1 hypothetical protein [Actinoplanes couchii]
MLRNETGKVAYRTLVTFEAVNAAGRTVLHESFRRFQTQVVPTVLPGASVAVGNASLLAEATQRGDDDLDSVVVKVQVSQWLDPLGGDHGLGKVTAAVVAGSGERSPDGKGSLELDVASANCANMASRGIALVFRDKSGAIVGGSLDNVPHDTCRVGGTTGEQVAMTDPEIPAVADLDRTQATAYCDFDRPQILPAVGAPYN